MGVRIALSQSPGESLTSSVNLPPAFIFESLLGMGVHTEPRQYNLRFIKQVNFLSGPPETSKCLILKPTDACGEGSAETNPQSLLNVLPYTCLWNSLPLKSLVSSGASLLI